VGGVVVVVVLLSTLSLPTRVEVELGCDNISNLLMVYFLPKLPHILASYFGYFYRAKIRVSISFAHLFYIEITVD
jgi:hypothetical protein